MRGGSDDTCWEILAGFSVGTLGSVAVGAAGDGSRGREAVMNPGGGSNAGTGGVGGNVGAVAWRWVGRASNNSLYCRRWAKWDSPAGDRGDGGAGFRRRATTSARAARMSSWDDGVGILTCSGNHARVSAIRSDLVARI